MRSRIAGVVVAGLVVVTGSSAAPLAGLVVSSAADTGPNTLREAITLANGTPGADAITFSIGAAGSQQTIALSSPLPAITDPVTVDGWSQGGPGYTGPPLVELSGAGAGSGADGLVLGTGSAGSVVSGLVVNGFSGNGITLGSAGVRVSGNRIGTNAAGTAAVANGGAGVAVVAGTGANVLGTNGDGTTDAAEGNLVSGNTRAGIEITAGSGNEVAGNLVGTDGAGTAAVPNRGPGITVQTSSNLIGSDGDGTGDAAERNLVSGNLGGPDAHVCSNRRGDGIQIGAAGTGNVVAGNYVGLNAAGTAAVPNDCDGIRVEGDANVVGTSGSGSPAAHRNVVAANRISNIHLPDAAGNVVAGNYVGTDAAGTASISYTFNPPTSAVTIGLWLDGASSTRVGTDGNAVRDTEERNVLAGNMSQGIEALRADDNVISGNWIGISASGAPLANGLEELRLRISDRNQVGTDGIGNVAAERNVIGGGAFGGGAVDVIHGSDDNVVAGNWIGTDTNGSGVNTYGASYGVRVRGIAPDGIGLIRCQRNRVGTNEDGVGDAAEANVMVSRFTGFSFPFHTVFVSASDDTSVVGNSIGVDAFGAPAGTQEWGVWIEDAARTLVRNNVIRNNASGGVALATRNPSSGVYLPPTDTTIQANDISANGGIGLQVLGGGNGGPPTEALVEANTIAGNGDDGVRNDGGSPTLHSNTITGNEGSGIRNDVRVNLDVVPTPWSDDVLSRPVIGGPGVGNTIAGNCTGGTTSCAGVYSVDTSPANGATIELDNAPAANSGAPFVEQRWRGGVELIQGGVPVSGSVTLTSANGGPTYALTVSSQCPGGMLNGTIVHGTIRCDLGSTWQQIVEYVVNAAGARVTYTPHSANGKQYSFDGNAATHSTNTGAGFNGDGVQTGSLLRYQLMEVFASPTSVAIRSFTARRTTRGRVALAWRTGSERDLLGFRLWRKLEGRSGWVSLARRLIPATGAVTGRVYRRSDRVVGGRGAEYRLDLIGARGNRVSVRAHVKRR